MELFIKFTDQSASFALGVELGRLMAQMSMQKHIVSNDGFPVHLENKEVITDTCKAYGYTPVFGAISFDEWIEFTAIKNNESDN